MLHNISKKDISFGLSLSTVVAVLVFCANLYIAGPMIQADESSYLANAAAMAGYLNDHASSYGAGYSLFLVPVFWIADNPTAAWLGVKVINAGFIFLLVMGLWVLSYQFRPVLEVRERLLSVALVSAYPMWVVLAGYSFAQIAFVPVFIFVFLLYYNSFYKGCFHWFFMGAGAAFLYWIHPTAIAVIIALIVSSGIIAIKRRCFKEFFVLIFAVAFVIIFYKVAFRPWLFERMTISGLSPNLHYPSIARMFSPLFEFDGLKNVIARLGGHIFYLSIGTVGLFWLGFFELCKNTKISSIYNLKSKDIDKNFQKSLIVFFLALSVLGITSMSVLMFSSTPEAQRLDHWMYGRYVEGVIAPILLIGAMAINYRKILWVVPIAIVCALLWYSGLESYTHIARFNVASFWQDFWLKDQGIWAWLASGSILILLAGILPRKISIFLIFSIFLFCNFLQINWHTTASANAKNRWEAALKVRELYPPGTCVGFDHSGINSYNRHVFWFDFAFVLFDYRLQRISVDEWFADCDGPIFSYDKNLNERINETHAVAVSPHGGPVLWAKGDLPETEYYPMKVEDRSLGLLQALGTGWHDMERTHVWSSSENLLELPVPERCNEEKCAVLLRLSAYGASSSRPVDLDISYENGERVKLVTFADTTPVDVRLPLKATNGSIMRLKLDVPNAISPQELQGSPDSRILGIALREIILDEPMQPGITYEGEQLANLPRSVGQIEGRKITSDSRSGFLVYGPYVPMSSDSYKLSVTGSADKADGSYVDIVSNQGEIVHAKFPLNTTSGDTDFIAEGEIVLSEPVSDLEIRVYVDAKDEVTLESYSFIPSP